MDLRECSICQFSEEILFELLLVVIDAFIRYLQDLWGTAVVLFQPIDLRLVVFRKIKNIPEIGTTPAVDGLCIITHYHQVPMRTRQVVEDLSLNPIGVLIFINQQMLNLLTEWQFVVMLTQQVQPVFQ